MAFVTPVMEHWLEREIAQWVHPMKDWSMSEHSTSELRPAPHIFICWIQQRLEWNFFSVDFGILMNLKHIYLKRHTDINWYRNCEYHLY